MDYVSGVSGVGTFIGNLKKDYYTVRCDELKLTLGN
jgi:hypothetical protein